MMRLLMLCASNMVVVLNLKMLSKILGEPNIDGALVGGASLVVDEFIDIIKAANQIGA